MRFQESMHLLSTLRKHTSKKIAITSKTVEGETYYQIIKAVKTEFDKQTKSEKVDPKILFDEFSNISNVCQNNARKLLSSISIEPTDKSEVKQNLEKVEDMVKFLKKLYEGKYATRMNRTITAKRKRDKTLKFTWKTELRQEVYRLYREEVERDSMQICQFMSKEPNGNINDKRILAEAIAIKNSLEDDQDFFIASNDMRLSNL